MTRPNLSVGVLAAVCVGTLLWCAWLILAADLPRGAHIASWVLWLVVAAAAVTLLAYLREFLAHRQSVGADAGWKPLPGLVLLWIGGLTALVSFAFILPDRTPSAGAGQDTAGTSLVSTTATGTPSDASETTKSGVGTTQGATGTRSTTAASTSRSSQRTTSPSSGPTAATATRPRSSSSSPTASPISTSSTTSPLIDLHILPTQAHPTTPPGR